METMLYFTGKVESADVRESHNMVQRFVDRLNAFAEGVVMLIGGGMVCFITVLVFLFRFDGYSSIPESDKVLTEVGILAVVLFGVWLLDKSLKRLHAGFRHLDKIILLITIMSSCGFCVVFLSGARILPSSDCRSVYDIAVRMSQGDMGAVVPEGSYLSLYPFQTGMIFLFEKMIRLFGTTEPFLFQMANVLYVALAILSGYGMVKRVTDRTGVIVLYLLLAGSCFPLFFNTGRIYGDVPSIALSLFFLWMFFLFWEKKGRCRWVYGFLGMAGAVLGCTYRRNTLICVIALVLAAFVHMLKDFKPAEFILFLCVLLFSAKATGLTQKYYEYYADNTCGRGMPASAYLAMGMQDSGGIPGGNNGFHTTTFLDSGYDREETVRISREAISESLKGFWEEPGRMADFYYRKLLLQWGNATCGCFWQLGDSFEQPQSKYALDLLYSGYGGRHEGMVAFMNYWQSTVYGIFALSFFHALWRRAREGKRAALYYYVPVIAFIGGFLFSMFWEAGPRYVMAYPILLLPLAVAGLWGLDEI